MNIPLLLFICSLNISIPVSVPSGSHGLMWLPTPSTDVLTANNVYSLYSPADPTTSFLHILLLFSPPLHLRRIDRLFKICFKYRSATAIIGTRLNHRPLCPPCPLPSPTVIPNHAPDNRSGFTVKSPTLHIYCMCLLLLPKSS